MLRAGPPATPWTEGKQAGATRPECGENSVRGRWRQLSSWDTSASSSRSCASNHAKSIGGGPRFCSGPRTWSPGLASSPRRVSPPPSQYCSGTAASPTRATPPPPGWSPEPPAQPQRRSQDSWSSALWPPRGRRRQRGSGDLGGHRLRWHVHGRAAALCFELARGRGGGGAER